MTAEQMEELLTDEAGRRLLKHIAPSLARRVLAAERVAEALENMIAAYSEPDRLMCCNGHHCGCMGATVRDEADWISRTAITAYREASK